MDEIKVLEEGHLRVSQWCAEFSESRIEKLDLDTPRLIFGTVANLQRAIQNGWIDSEIFPPELLAGMEMDLNGNFRSRDYESYTGKTQDLWFTFKIKQVSSDGYLSRIPTSQALSYKWIQITTFIRRDASGVIRLIVCLGCSTLEGFMEKLGFSELQGSGLTFVALLDHIISLYDKSVWTLRDWVRNAELVRNTIDAYSTSKDRLIQLHEVARHLIHSNETLDIAINTTENIRRVAETAQISDNEIERANGRNRLHEACEDLKRIKRRSESLSERLENEIQLANNLMTQRDSGVMVKLSELSRKDNSNMRSVAIMGLIYLPATFVSGLFGMNFFQFCGDSGNEIWKVSDQFWMYWAITIPLTLVTVLVWTLAFHADSIRLGVEKLTEIWRRMTGRDRI